MFDLILRGGLVVGGVGPVTADVGVIGSHISCVDVAIDRPARCEVDVRGLVVLPGFIDAHSHTDETALLPSMYSKVRQGITTEVTGQCGGSAAPVRSDEGARHRASLKLEEDGYVPSETFASFESFRARLDAGIAASQLTFVGWWSLFDDVVRFGHRTLDRALTELEEILEQGAPGVSIHAESASFAALQAPERDRMFRALGRRGGILAVHFDSYDSAMIASLDELLATAERRGVRLQLSHLKVLGPDRPSQLAALLVRVGHPHLRFDVTPADDVCTRARFLRERIGRTRGAYLADFRSIHSIPPGWSLLRAGDKWTREEMNEIVAWLDAQPGTLVSVVGIEQRDVEALLEHPSCFVGTDAGARPLTNEESAPARAFQSFFRALRWRRLRGATWDEIARQFSAEPAEWFGLPDRGRIDAGLRADLVVVDPSDGPRTTVVGGKLAVRNGVATSELGGCAAPWIRSGITR
jgi:N-acyl-D-amino-acid deacylase